MDMLRYLILGTLLVLGTYKALAGKRVLVSQGDDGTKEYIELYQDADTVYGYYYGHYSSAGKQKAYKAVMVIETFRDDRVRFSISNYSFGCGEILPSLEKSMSSVIDSCSYDVKGASYDFWGEFENGKLVIKKQMSFARSAFEELTFTEPK